MSEFNDWLHNESTVDSMTNPYDAARDAWNHQQAKIDELQRQISIYKKHVSAIKTIHETQFCCDSDSSWILGNLDGFFECLEDDLRGNHE